MSKRESIARYNLIISRLRKSSATFAEINDYLEQQSELQGYNLTISNRTFQRDIEDISSLYNVEIKYNFSQKQYCIVTEEKAAVNERMLEAFNLFYALNTADELSKYLLFEKRQPQGSEHLYGLLHAIKNHLRITFVYRKFKDELATNRSYEPCALKEFKNRWYVVGKDVNDDNIKIFGLDRISRLEITKRTFSNNDFDVQKYFEHCFGIIVPKDIAEPKKVVLSINPLKWKFIQSLPLHESQKLIFESKKEVQISLVLYITHDLIMELLSHGNQIKVLQPDILKIEMGKACFKA